MGLKEDLAKRVDILESYHTTKENFAWIVTAGYITVSFWIIKFLLKNQSEFSIGLSIPFLAFLYTGVLYFIHFQFRMRWAAADQTAILLWYIFNCNEKKLDKCGGTKSIKEFCRNLFAIDNFFYPDQIREDIDIESLKRKKKICKGWWLLIPVPIFCFKTLREKLDPRCFSEIPSYVIITVMFALQIFVVLTHR